MALCVAAAVHGAGQRVPVPRRNRDIHRLDARSRGPLRSRLVLPYGVYQIGDV